MPLDEGHFFALGVFYINDYVLFAETRDFWQSDHGSQALGMIGGSFESFVILRESEVKNSRATPV